MRVVRVVSNSREISPLEMIVGWKYVTDSLMIVVMRYQCENGSAQRRSILAFEGTTTRRQRHNAT